MARVHDRYKGSPYFGDQRQFFDELITHDWDKYENQRWNRTRKIEVSRILAKCRSVLRGSVGSVLDVGCGCGYHDLLLARHPDVNKVIGVDYSAESVKQANRYYPHPKIERLPMDVFSPVAVDQLVTNFGRFDLVASFQVIEHLENPAEFLKVCAECAKNSGCVAIVMPNRLRAQNAVRSKLGKELILMDFLHYREYTFEELIELAAGADLQPVGRFGHTFNLHKWRLGISGVALGTILPRWADFIGMVFVKKAS